jgi:hypothetical protein
LDVGYKTFNGNISNPLTEEELAEEIAPPSNATEQPISDFQRYFGAIGSEFDSDEVDESAVEREGVQTVSQNDEEYDLDPDHPLVLKDLDGSPVLSQSGAFILCVGGWKSPSTWNRFKSALSNVHALRGHAAPYSPPCEACVHGMCRLKDHEGEKRLDTAFGNPLSERSVNDYFGVLQAEGSSNCRSGGPTLTPIQLKDLVERLIGIGDIQSTVIIVLSTHMYLRTDEVLSLRFEDLCLDDAFFDTELQLLPLKVWGKHASGFYVLTLQRNRNFPLMCPITMLQWWICLHPSKKGWIFPSASDSSQPVKYSSFFRSYKKVLAEVEPESATRSYSGYGCHMLRRTGIACAIMNKQDETSIMQASRIKSHNTFLIYRGCTDFILAKLELARVKFRPIVSSFRTLITQLGTKIMSKRPSLTMILDSFMEKYSCWRDSHIMLKSFQGSNYLQKELLEKLRRFQVMLKSEIIDVAQLQELTSNLLDTINENAMLGNKVIRLTETSQLDSESDSTSDQEQTGTGTPGIPVVATIIADSSEPEVTPVVATIISEDTVERDNLNLQSESQKQQDIRFDCLAERSSFVKQFQSASSLPEKIHLFNSFLDRQEIVLDVVSKKPSTVKLKDSLRKWIADVVAPIYNCLRNHCDGREDEFVNRWSGKFTTITKFKSLCTGSSTKPCGT